MCASHITIYLQNENNSNQKGIIFHHLFEEKES